MQSEGQGGGGGSRTQTADTPPLKIHPNPIMKSTNITTCMAAGERRKRRSLLLWRPHDSHGGSGPTQLNAAAVSLAFAEMIFVGAEYSDRGQAAGMEGT